MSLSVLEIEKGEKDLRNPFKNKTKELKVLEQELLKDKKVQLYLFLHNEIKNAELKESMMVNDYYSEARKQCEHPLYVCVTNGNETNYVYKCICLNCGATKHFKQYELDELFKEHRVIAQKIDFLYNSGNESHYYMYLPNFNEAFEYYKDCCKHIKEVNGKLNDEDSKIEEVAAEMTFNHFINPSKDKKGGKQYIKKQ